MASKATRIVGIGDDLPEVDMIDTGGSVSEAATKFPSVNQSKTKWCEHPSHVVHNRIPAQNLKTDPTGVYITSNAIRCEQRCIKLLAICRIFIFPEPSVDPY